MSKYVFNDSIKDLKCHQNHENSPVILVQLQPEEQINKLLCVLCLETVKSDFKTISIQFAITQIKNQLENQQLNIESQLKQRVQLLESLQIQICDMKQTVDELFSSLSQKVIEWKDQIKDVMKQTIEINLQNQLQRYTQQIELYEIPTCQDNITQINSEFSQFLEIEIGKIKEIVKNFEIKKKLQIIQNDNKKDSELFPKSQKLLHSINCSNNTIEQMTFNYNNTLLFVLAGKYFQSLNLINWEVEDIVKNSNHCFQNIIASRKINQVVVYDEQSILSLYNLEQNKKWQMQSSLKIYLGRISFIGLDKDECQIILKSRENLSIVKYDKLTKKLLYLNSIPLMTQINSLRMIESSNTLLGAQYQNLLLYQQNNLEEWILIQQIPLPSDHYGLDAFQVDENNILVKCDYKNSISCFLYRQEQFFLIEEKFVFENFTKFEFNFIPSTFNQIQSLFLQKIDQRYHLIKQTKENKFIAWSQVICATGNHSLTEWSNDGKFFALWDSQLSEIRILELIY